MMKPVHMLQGILLAAASVEGAQTFYTKVKGSFVRLKTMHTPDYELIAYGGRSPLLPMPLFTLRDRIATTLYGNCVKVFGMVNDYYVIGPESKVKPLEIHLDKDSRVLNLRLHMCTCPSQKFDSLKMNDESCSEDMKCTPSDIYFMSPDEADKHSLSRVRNKRDTEPEATNQVLGANGNILDGDILDGKNLSGKNLDGKNLSGKNSGGENLDGKNLGGKNSGGENSGGENLDGNILDGDNFGGKNLDGKNLGGKNSGGENSGGKNLSGKNLDGKNLSGKNLDGKNSGGENLNGNILDGDNFGGKNLDGENLNGNILDGDNFGGKNLDGENLNGKNFNEKSGSEPVDTELYLFLASKPRILNPLLAH